MNEDTYRDKLNDQQREVEALRAKLKEAQTGDLISRQAALTALTSTAGVGNRELDKIRALPSAQSQQVTGKLNADCISRKAAIDALSMMQGIVAENGVRKGISLAWQQIKDLPSAQPEIVRCKDCKHRDPEDKKCDCGHDIQWQLPRQDDWYCADAERREE